MTLNIPPNLSLDLTGAPQLSAVTPLSPIAFDFAGPRELRQRREVELDRCMKDLGFVEATPPATAKTSPPSSARGRHMHSFSIQEEEEHDVVLLVDDHTDSENEHPTRSESRAAMLTLFTDIDTLPSPVGPKSMKEPTVDVQVQVVSKTAGRSKRRFSRKWVREQSGKRWTEKDFSQIISQLRKLR